LRCNKVLDPQRPQVHAPPLRPAAEASSAFSPAASVAIVTWMRDRSIASSSCWNRRKVPIWVVLEAEPMVSALTRERTLYKRVRLYTRDSTKEMPYMKSQ
jgi:hypothetical protein